MRDGRCFARGELSGCEICGSPGDRKGNWYKGPGNIIVLYIFKQGLLFLIESRSTVSLSN